MNRFDFMRECVAHSTGKVLNVGCHMDGAGLRLAWPERVLNCDIRVQPGYTYTVDVFFDARGEWPFQDGYAGLVVLGDILEHMYDHEIRAVLAEARRVSQGLCITVPCDIYLADPIDPAAQPRAHCNTIDEAKIRTLVGESGWEIDTLEVLRDTYEPGSEEYMILAH